MSLKQISDTALVKQYMSGKNQALSTSFKTLLLK